MTSGVGVGSRGRHRNGGSGVRRSSGLEIHPPNWQAGHEWPCRSAAPPAAFIHAMDARCSLAQAMFSSTTAFSCA